MRSVRVTEAVVIHNFGDFYFAGAIDRLRDFVVVDEYETCTNWLKDIRFAEYAEQVAVFIDDMADERAGLDDATADDGKFFLRVELWRIALDESADQISGADRPGGCGAIVVAINNGEFRGLSEFERFRAHFIASRDDDEADAAFDAAAVYVIAIAYDNDALAVRYIFIGGEFTEGFEVHRSDAHEEFVDRVFVEHADRGALDGLHDIFNRGRDLTHCFGALRFRDEVIAKTENGNIAFEVALCVDDGKGADVVFIEDGEGARAGIIDRNGKWIRLHDVFNTWGDIADEFRK